MADSVAGAPQVADYSQWRARDYYDTYYSQTILPDEQAVLAYQVSAMVQAGGCFEHALEYGCGPTLHRAIAAAGYTRHIDMSDWLADNLIAVRDWVEAGANNTDWRRFTAYILALEGNPLAGRAELRARENRTRSAIRALYVSDARWSDPLGPQHRGFYDLIVSGFCLDAVSSDKAVWRTCMHNVLSTMRPGGTVVLHFLHECRAYKCGARLFPAANLTVDDVAESLRAEGFARGSIDVQVIACPDNAQFGYTGILTASARKR
ncbi:MAG: NNMT/PNMT/TEMT family class I SAM-dependent methyltransferase [Steroidobacteraceae bacterium]|nr:NNMT/PNMT/TEMT family class I SAM-dependent methyltransferase [Steroidobacteraceae bacterium]MDW8257855.1 guanitoxin biosynthesis pre-guanitoxin forming N-methyltransferase GntF [Gammaproteobacteria bacterium]